MNFVGANTGNPGPLLTQDGQVHQDGYPKYTITEDNNNLNGNVQPAGKPSNNGGYWLTGTGGRAAIFPDDILLLIGSNDNDGSTDANVIDQRLELMVTKIFLLRPNTHLFLASIPPLPVPTDAGKTAIAKSYNQLIKNKIVPKFLVAGRNIRFVNQYTNFIAASSDSGDTVITGLFGDNIHPNEAGYQLMGNTWSAALLNDPVVAPVAPSALTATAVSANQINLNWTDNSTNEVAFIIERSPDNATFTLLDYVGADVTNYVNAGLSSATTYYYRVRAKNNVGDSPNSNVASATTLATSLVAAPGGLSAAPGYRKVILQWNAASAASSYNVKRSTTNGGPYVTITNPTVTNYTDTGLVNGTTYYYVVSSVGGGGEAVIHFLSAQRRRACRWRISALKATRWIQAAITTTPFPPACSIMAKGRSAQVPPRSTVRISPPCQKFLTPTSPSPPGSKPPALPIYPSLMANRPELRRTGPLPCKTVGSPFSSAPRIRPPSTRLSV